MSSDKVFDDEMSMSREANKIREEICKRLKENENTFFDSSSAFKNNDLAIRLISFAKTDCVSDSFKGQLLLQIIGTVVKLAKDKT